MISRSRREAKRRLCLVHACSLPVPPARANHGVRAPDGATASGRDTVFRPSKRPEAHKASAYRHRLETSRCGDEFLGFRAGQVEFGDPRADCTSPSGPRADRRCRDDQRTLKRPERVLIATFGEEFIAKLSLDFRRLRLRGRLAERVNEAAVRAAATDAARGYRGS